MHYFLYFCLDMQSISHISPRYLRFRRWNRHNYSTFCSIGRCVNIGCVRKEIADKSLKKGQFVIIHDKDSTDRYFEEQEPQWRESCLSLEITCAVSLAICPNRSLKNGEYAGRDTTVLPICKIQFRDNAAFPWLSRTFLFTYL